MKFKRISAIIFPLLATLILMAHTAIPHHHHINQVCLIAAHCQNVSDRHHHEGETPLHEHDGTNDSENCVLKQLVAIPSYHAKLIIKDADLETDHDGFYGDIAGITDTYSDNFNSRVNSLSRLPVSSSAYSILISYSLGLRGPPIV